MKHFYIAALPRSRTAWLASFLSSGPVFCLHDPVAHLSSLEALPEVLDLSGYTHTGVADTGLSLFPEWVPDGPLAVIRRDPETVVTSFLRAFPEANRTLVEVLKRRGVEGLDRLAALPGTLSVDFEALSERATVRRLWEHLLPDVVWDEMRYTLWEGLRVMVNPETVLRRFEEVA